MAGCFPFSQVEKELGNEHEVRYVVRYTRGYSTDLARAGVIEVERSCLEYTEDRCTQRVNASCRRMHVSFF